MISSDIIVVGYKTELCEDAADKIPKFEHNKGTKDAETQLRQIQDKINKFLDSARRKPWLANLSSIWIFDTRTGQSHKFTYGQAGTAAAQFASHIHEHHADQFNSDGSYCGAPIRLIGFNVKEFVKMVGLSCSRDHCPLPHELWYGADHRDMRHAILPTTECKDVPLSAALHDLEIKTVPYGYEPGDKPETDLKLSAEIALRLNLFPEFRDHLSRVVGGNKTRRKIRKKASVTA